MDQIITTNDSKMSNAKMRIKMKNLEERVQQLEDLVVKAGVLKNTSHIRVAQEQQTIYVDKNGKKLPF